LKIDKSVAVHVGKKLFPSMQPSGIQIENGIYLEPPMTKPRLASWIVIQALDASRENIDGYEIQDAHGELNDLTDAVEIVAAQDGATAEVEQMRETLKDVQSIVEEMKAARDAKLKSSGINIAFEQGFEMRMIGSVSQLYKAIPDVDGHYIIDIGGGIDPTVNAEMKDWGVTVVINSNGLKNYAVVAEKLTLEEALDVYQELPLPVDDKLVQNVYQTWEDAGVTLNAGGPKL
jgi:hypothetical protein